jgi:outer membrane protein OmpA-like peptidoglycan-associated protein
MKYHVQKRILFALFLLFVIEVFGQNNISPLKPQLFGLHLTLVDYNSPTLIRKTSLKEVIKKGDIFDPSKQSLALTISYWKGINKNIDFAGKLNGISYDYRRHIDPLGVQYNNEFGAEMESTLNFHPVTDAHFFSPIITAGIGVGYYTNKLGGYIPLGLGWQFNFTNKVYVFFQSQYRFSLSTKVFPDNLLHSIGVAVNLSPKKPANIAPIPIPDAQLSDRDNDTVADSLDVCPDLAGTVSANGCPDTDGDGIADINDSCPNIRGFNKYRGCPVPDTDKDGINDEEDKCPTEAGAARFQGCPIPDTDEDGINDEDDKCPDQAGPASTSGCPEIRREIIEKVTLAAKNIYFPTGSDMLLKKSDAYLNSVVQILKDNPSLKVHVEGHTDASGQAAKNQELSELRTISVKIYLMDKGIDGNRISRKGYGSTQPVADNKTPAGRAKNRRVELKLRNY